MLKITSAALAISLLTACSTPRPVVDVASRVAKMSDNMDRSIVRYVDSLNTARQMDATLLEGLRSDANVHKRANQDQIQVMTIVDDTRALSLMNNLSLVPDPDPMAALAQAPGIAATPVSFDASPLRTVAKISNDIATPGSRKEQLSVLVKAVQTVNDDLKKAASENVSR